MTVNEPPVLQVSSVADLLSFIPYGLGYHPQTSLVTIGLHEESITFATRVDLPETGTPVAEFHADLQAHAAVVARQVTEAVIIGYGPAGRVDPVLNQAEEAFGACGVRVHQLLRVEDGRFYDYHCDNPACCPPQGTAFDPTSSVIAAYATFAGKVALPSRAALAAIVAPVQGPARAGMQQAGQRARARLAALVTQAATGSSDSADTPALVLDTDRGDAAAQGQVAAIDVLALQAGQDVIVQAFDRYRSGDSLTDDEAAWLCLLLDYIPVRDFAFEQTHGRDEDVRLWTDLTRRAEPGLVRAPATLLTFAAWRCGDGTLATLALDRAVADDPTYGMAKLLSQLVGSGVSPAAWEGWSTVEGDDLQDPRTTAD